MARKVTNQKLDTRTARLKAPGRREPYWTKLGKGLALGYRPGRRGGHWIARAYLPDRTPTKLYEALGAADDMLDADGVKVWTFDQAQALARAWFNKMGRDGTERRADGPYTVEAACRDYLDWFETERKSVIETRRTVEAHILPALGALDTAKLSDKVIKGWQKKLASTPARLRSKRFGVQALRAVPSTDDEKRKRRATANRVLTVLKAALNHAWRERIIESDDAWRRVAPFKGVDLPVVRYLTRDECLRLVNASSGGFRRLVQTALLTGCRYGELRALKVADFDPDAGTLLVRVSKGGRPRHVYLTDDGRALLSSLAAGRLRDETLLVRDDGGAWGTSHQKRAMREACANARVMPAASFHVLRHTHASLLAMQGAPMPVIARQLGHADTRMTERHYAHLAPDYVSETIRANFPNLGIVDAPKVVSILRPVSA